MTYLYLSKSISDGKEFHNSHNEEYSLVEKMLDEKVISAIAYDTEKKVFSKVEPIVTSENKIWVSPGMPLAKEENNVHIGSENSEESNGLYVLIKSTEDDEQYLYFTGDMEDFRELYLSESDNPGPIKTLAFIDLDKGTFQPLGITFKGFQFQITPVQN